MVIAVLGILGMFIPCYFGIKLGAGFATVLGVVSMVPLTVLVLLPLFKPSSIHLHNLSGFHFAARGDRQPAPDHGVDVRDDLERAGHGGGGLLHR